MLMMGQKNYDEMKNIKKIINISMLKVFWKKTMKKFFRKCFLKHFLLKIQILNKHNGVKLRNFDQTLKSDKTI